MSPARAARRSLLKDIAREYWSIRAMEAAVGQATLGASEKLLSE